MIDRPHPVVGKQLRHQTGHRRPVLQYVGDPRGDADVVLDHLPGAVAVTHQVTAGDMGVDAARGADAVDGAGEVRAGDHQPPGHEPLPHDLPSVVDVIDEVVQGPNSLGEAPLDVPPFLAAQHPRHEVEGKGAFMGGAPAAAGLEGDPLLHEDCIPASPCLDQTRGTKAPELFHQRQSRRAGSAVELEELVQEGSLGTVGVDLRGRGGHVNRRCGTPRAHHRILPRGLPLDLRRLDKSGSSAMLTCNSYSQAGGEILREARRRADRRLGGVSRAELSPASGRAE